ncbi:MAG: hypothetical protein H0V82_00690 [Candidatus Protochlamydia sp.]|nr:hypothetical protein [Candidatus Protochlamydia sp.]
MLISSNIQVFNQVVSSFNNPEHEYIQIDRNTGLAKPISSKFWSSSFKDITNLVKGTLESNTATVEEKREILRHFSVIKNKFEDKKLNFIMKLFFGNYKTALISEAYSVLAQGRAIYPEIIENLTEEEVTDEVVDESQNPNLPSEIKVEEAPIILPGEENIDVPDNGDCLFCAIGLGMKLKYSDNQEIQNKLNWNVDPTVLRNHLRNTGNLLDEPSANLRKQAYEYLLANFNTNETFQIELMGSIMEYNDGIERAIKNDLSNPDGYDDEASKCIQKGIEDALQKFLKDDDFEGYLNLAKEKGFSCGNVEIAALSLIYNIPIHVFFKYGEEGQNSRNFNLLKSNLPPIKLAHVGGNHFQLLHIPN